MALVGAVSVTAALLVLFVILPFAVAGGVISFISWRSAGDPAPARTSDVLRTGEAARAEIVSVRNLGTILDVRPMVRVGLRVTPHSGEPFDTDVTQAFTRAEVRDLVVGSSLDVRVLPDRSAVAIEATA